MEKLTGIFIFMLLCATTKSQSIYSALHLNEERAYKTIRPRKIIETKLFYNSSGKQEEKNIELFDPAGMLLTEERYDADGKLTARLTYSNDTIQRLKLSRVFEQWMSIGYRKETAFYTYDARHFLIGITDKDAGGNLIRETTILCNDKGQPLDLAVSDGKGGGFGKETATYLYDKNKAVTSVFANDGSALSSDTITISFIHASDFPGSNETYNSHGDATSYMSKSVDGKGTLFEVEYTYDNLGNCTEEKIFKVKVKGNGSRKREIDRIFKKEYFY